jgi:hypothetical protein
VRYHGIVAPNAKRRSAVVPTLPEIRLPVEATTPTPIITASPIVTPSLDFVHAAKVAASRMATIRKVGLSMNSGGVAAFVRLRGTATGTLRIATS